MNPVEHRRWTEDAVARLAARPDVVGVVAMGSTANASRVDEWSDHDIAIIVEPGAEASYRGATEWMPDRNRIVFSLEEHHGGGKAVYDDGHLVEWGVATVTSLAGWAADDYAVLLDRGGVAGVMEAVAATPFPPNEQRLERDCALFLATILHGVGRARRGEVLSGGDIVRGDAVRVLIRALRAQTSHGDGDLESRGTKESVLDRLDGLRRVEAVFPVAAEQIADAVAGDVESAAQALLGMAASHLGTGPDGLRPEAVAAVTRRLGWPHLG